jgi:2-polyprenyl-3-methyl-5-hydroxy-6-metoxy-1,4-benzoquinol methylase
VTTLEQTESLQEKVLQENRRVHASENRLYLDRHPEQTNFFQKRILKSALQCMTEDLVPANSHILDLGCGTGYTTLELLTQGFAVTGVDLSKEMIAGLRERVADADAECLRLEVSDVESFLSKESVSYDAVVVSALLHHLYDYENVVRKIAAQLVPGGKLLIFFEPLKQTVRSPFRFALHRSLARVDEALYVQEMRLRKIPLFAEDYELSDYQRRFGGIDPNRVSEILSQEGLKVQAIEKYCSRRYGLNALIASQLLHTQNTFNLIAVK